MFFLQIFLLNMLYEILTAVPENRSKARKCFNKDQKLLRLNPEMFIETNHLGRKKRLVPQKFLETVGIWSWQSIQKSSAKVRKFLLKVRTQLFNYIIVRKHFPLRVIIQTRRVEFYNPAENFPPNSDTFCWKPETVFRFIIHSKKSFPRKLPSDTLEEVLALLPKKWKAISETLFYNKLFIRCSSGQVISFLNHPIIFLPNSVKFCGKSETFCKTVIHAKNRIENQVAEKYLFTKIKLL